MHLTELVTFYKHETENAIVYINVADPGCLSWILDPVLWIPDFGSKNINKREGGTNFCPTFFEATNITKLKNYLIFELVKKIFFNYIQSKIQNHHPKISATVDEKKRLHNIWWLNIPEDPYIM
jgi:hypothetical protein